MCVAHITVAGIDWQGEWGKCLTREQGGEKVALDGSGDLSSPACFCCSIAIEPTVTTCWKGSENSAFIRRLWTRVWFIARCEKWSRQVWLSLTGKQRAVVLPVACMALRLSATSIWPAGSKTSGRPIGCCMLFWLLMTRSSWEGNVRLKCANDLPAISSRHSGRPSRCEKGKKKGSADGGDSRKTR